MAPAKGTTSTRAAGDAEACPSLLGTLVAERIPVRDYPGVHRLTGSAYAIEGDGSSIAFVFRYGVLVTIGFSSPQREALVDALRALSPAPVADVVEERIELAVLPDATEGVDDRGVVLRDMEVQRLLVVSDVLAKSLVLDYYEGRVGEAFERIEPLAQRLYQSGRAARGTRELLRQVGQVLLIQHHTVWRVEVDDKPELVWDRPDLERLYLLLADEYELRERHQALERKLALLAETAETLVGLLQHGRSLRVEWYIVILILAEFGLTLFEMLAP